MAISSYPPVTPKRTVVTLTTGTSWTVPTGVTSVNVALFGAGGGSGGVNCISGNATSGGTGGTTTFTGATSATGGSGSSASNDLRANGFDWLASAAGKNNTGIGAFGGARYLQSGLIYYYQSNTAQNGQIISSTLSATAGATITYAIGAGGTAGSAGTGAGTAGAAGGSGKIEIEYWV